MPVQRAAGYVLSWIALVALTACQSAEHETVGASEAPAEAQVSWQTPQHIATGNAHVGPWRMNESEFHYIDDATVDLHQDAAAVAWVNNEQQDVFLQVYTETGHPAFETPVNVSRSGSIFSWLPRVVFASKQHIYLLWQEIIFSGGAHGGEIFFARSEDGGRHFKKPINLSNTVAGAGKGRLTRERWDNGSLDLLLSPNGDLFVAWTDYEGGLYVRHSTDAGRSFDETIKVSGSDTQPARAPSLTMTPDNTLYLAWSLGEDPEADIQFTVSEDHGKTFAAAQSVHSSGGHSDTPSLAADNEGRVHLVYGESTAGPFTQTHVRYSRLDGPGQSWREPQVISGSHNQGAPGAQAPVLQFDNKNGRLVVLWEHHPASNQRARGLAFVVSQDRGQIFSSPAPVPGSEPPGSGFNGSVQGQLGHKLATGDGDLIAVVNSLLTPAEQSEIVMIRGQWRSP